MPVPRGTTLDPSRTRDAIVAAATDLLYQRGLDGIGVADLCREFGVSKETLYRHFGSKDGLIQAVLERRSDRVIRWLTNVVAAAGEDPVAQLGAVFDAFDRWYDEPDFRGCAIMNAATQHHADPVRPIAARHLDRYLLLLTGIATRAGVAEPVAIARQLLMLLEGATVCADYANTDGRTAELAKAAALKLLGGN